METLNLSTCADSSTDTKPIPNNLAKKRKEKRKMAHKSAHRDIVTYRLNRPRGLFSEKGSPKFAPCMCQGCHFSTSDWGLDEMWIGLIEPFGWLLIINCINISRLEFPTAGVQSGEKRAKTASVWILPLVPVKWATSIMTGQSAEWWLHGGRQVTGDKDDKWQVTGDKPDKCDRCDRCYR